MYNNLFDKAIETLKHYIKMPSANWDEERCAAMRFIARCYQFKGDITQSRVWLYRAIAECPIIREPYLQMARLGYIEKNWPLVLLMVREALKITKTTGSYLLELDAWGESLYDLGAIACYWLKMYRESHDYAAEACRISPHDPRLQKNLEIIDEMLPSEAKSNG